MEIGLVGIINNMNSKYHGYGCIVIKHFKETDYAIVHIGTPLKPENYLCIDCKHLVISFETGELNA